jgi:hypothetical protein
MALHSSPHHGSQESGLHVTRSGEVMNTKTFRESFKAESENVVEKVKELVHEGNVRRVIVKHEGRVVAEFPLTAGVVGAVLAPVLAAIAALFALMKDCTIEVERTRNQDSLKSAQAPVGVGSVDDQC